MTDTSERGTTHEPIAPDPRDREIERDMDPTKRDRPEPPDLGGRAPHMGDRPIEDEDDDEDDDEKE